MGETLTTEREIGPGADVTLRVKHRGDYAREAWPESRLLGPLAPRTPTPIATFSDFDPIPVEKAPLSWRVRNFVVHRWRGDVTYTAARLANKLFGVSVLMPELRARVIHWGLCVHCQERRILHINGSIDHPFVSDITPYATDYGVLGRRLITTAGVTFMVDAFGNTKELENFKYHGYGTGAGAENVSNTALSTELTTQYVSDNTRPTGSQTENGATVYRTVGTLDPDADVTITEHGLFDQAANSGGTLWDKTLFSGIALVGAAGDTLETTHDTTCAAGG